MDDRKALIVAISGCSSSGKTTLARLLRDIFPDAFILHEDDFYRPETELPMKNGLLDWDCAEAIDIPAMADALSHILQHATLPPSLDSKEDKNSVGKCPVSPSTIASLKAKVASSFASSSPSDDQESTAIQHHHHHHHHHHVPRICLLDGFLLYPTSMSPLHAHLDMKFFLRVSYAKAKARREARDGYVTLEGFWADPPGYVDQIVWPNYVESHAWMFEGGDVEAKFRRDVLEREGIRVPTAEEEGSMDGILEWMVGLVLDELKKHA